jgi:hypothetical protein
MPNFQRHVFVCVNERPADDPRGSCLPKGGAAVRDRFKAELKNRGVAKVVERLLMPDQPQVDPKRRLPVIKTLVKT